MRFLKLCVEKHSKISSNVVGLIMVIGNSWQFSTLFALWKTGGCGFEIQKNFPDIIFIIILIYDSYFLVAYNQLINICSP